MDPTPISFSKSPTPQPCMPTKTNFGSWLRLPSEQSKWYARYKTRDFCAVQWSIRKGWMVLCIYFWQQPKFFPYSLMEHYRLLEIHVIGVAPPVRASISRKSSVCLEIHNTRSEAYPQHREKRGKDPCNLTNAILRIDHWNQIIAARYNSSTSCCFRIW